MWYACTRWQVICVFFVVLVTMSSCQSQGRCSIMFCGGGCVLGWSWPIQFCKCTPHQGVSSGYRLMFCFHWCRSMSPFFTCLNFSCCCKIQVRDYDWPLGPSSLNELFDWPKWNADRLIKSDFAPDVREMLSENLLRNIVIHDAYSGMGTAGYTLHLQHAHLCRDWFAIWSSQFAIVICHCLYPCFEFNCICHAFALHGIFAVFAGRYCD